MGLQKMGSWKSKEVSKDSFSNLLKLLHIQETDEILDKTHPSGVPSLQGVELELFSCYYSYFKS